MPPPDELHGLRFHCWVLVLAGKREVPLNFFIEATSGRSRAVDDEDYLGIESLWNHKNYWVNMQDCASGVKVSLFHCWSGPVYTCMQFTLICPSGLYNEHTCNLYCVHHA